MLSRKKVILRALEMSDLDNLYKWENDTSIWNLGNTVTPFSKDILIKYLENSLLDIYTTKQLRLAIDTINSEKCIGFIDLFDFDPKNNRAGVGIIIADKDERHKGYASESLKLLIDYCFNILELHQIYCNICSNNESSLNLFKNNNFTIEGKKQEWVKTSGGYIDEYFLQLINKK